MQEKRHAEQDRREGSREVKDALVFMVNHGTTREAYKKAEEALKKVKKT